MIYFYFLAMKIRIRMQNSIFPVNSPKNSHLYIWITTSISALCGLYKATLQNCGCLSYLSVDWELVFAIRSNIKVP